MRTNPFPVKKGEVIETGEGCSSTAKHDGVAYFEDGILKMVAAPEATDSRGQFEAHWIKRNVRGMKSTINSLKRDSDGHYYDYSVNRHYVTWQAGRESMRVEMEQVAA